MDVELEIRKRMETYDESYEEAKEKVNQYSTTDWDDDIALTGLAGDLG